MCTPAHAARRRKLGSRSPAPSSPVRMRARRRQLSCSPTGSSSVGSSRKGVASSCAIDSHSNLRICVSQLEQLGGEVSLPPQRLFKEFCFCDKKLHLDQ